MPIPLGILAAAGFRPPSAASDFELLESAILTSNQQVITFSGLAAYASTYRHLQLRVAARDTRGLASQNTTRLQFNGDTSANYYSSHTLEGNRSSVVSTAGSQITYIEAFLQTSSSATANLFTGAVVDILDPFATNKNTTLRSFHSGVTGVFLRSGLWMNTSALTSISLIAFASNYVAGSRFSLYGIRG